jgi:hypothetical protein
MRIYKLYKTLDGKDAAYIFNGNGSMTSFIFDENNPDYQEYLAWLEKGNEPEPAEE